MVEGELFAFVLEALFVVGMLLVLASKVLAFFVVFALALEVFVLLGIL